MNIILSDAIRLVRNRLEQGNDLSRQFAGQCGLAQSILHFGLKDMGYDMKPLATQALKHCFFGHAAGSIEIDGTSYLVDATYTQFLESSVGLAPAKILSNTQEGRDLLKALVEDGYVELTPQKAHLYLKSFFNGDDLNITPDEALDFIQNPPKSSYNLCYGSDDKRATRQSLVEDGYLPEDPVTLPSNL